MNDKVKAVLSDPAKLEEYIQRDFNSLDTEKKGYITYDVLFKALEKQYKHLGLNKTPTEEDMTRCKKTADPEGTGKITFENYAKLIKVGIERMKSLKKI